MRSSSACFSSPCACGICLPSCFCSARSRSYSAMEDRRCSSAARAWSTTSTERPRLACPARTRSGSSRRSRGSITRQGYRSGSHPFPMTGNMNGSRPGCRPTTGGAGAVRRADPGPVPLPPHRARCEPAGEGGRRTVMARRPIGPVDTIWLNMDRPDNLMVIDTLVFLAGPADWDRVVAVVRERLLDRYPVFTQRPVMPLAHVGTPHWEDDPDFDLERHLVRVDPGPRRRRRPAAVRRGAGARPAGPGPPAVGAAPRRRLPRRVRALLFWPSASVLPITAASSTAGCCTSVASTSNGLT